MLGCARPERREAGWSHRGLQEKNIFYNYSIFKIFSAKNRLLTMPLLKKRLVQLFFFAIVYACKWPAPCNNAGGQAFPQYPGHPDGAVSEQKQSGSMGNTRTV